MALRKLNALDGLDLHNKDMPVLVEMQNTGDPRLRSEIVAVI